jgi:hypothetical protein
MYFFATISYQEWCTKNVSSPSMDLCVSNKKSDCKNQMLDEFEKVTNQHLHNNNPNNLN